MRQSGEQVRIGMMVNNATVVLYDIMYITTVLTLSITFISIFGVILVETQNFTRDFTSRKLRPSIHNLVVGHRALQSLHWFPERRDKHRLTWTVEYLSSEMTLQRLSL